MRIRARHYATAQPIEVECSGGVIHSVGQPTGARADLQGEWIAPALFDVQINGCDGRGFSSSDLSVADVRHSVEVCRRHGIAGLCPTLVTNSFSALKHGFSVLRQACDED